MRSFTRGVQLMDARHQQYVRCTQSPTRRRESFVMMTNFVNGQTENGQVHELPSVSSRK